MPGTAAPTSTETQTPTPTVSQTPFIFFTFTPLVPRISVSVPTNCRTGPSTIYNITGALLVGQSVQVYAQDPTGTWWQIKDPSGGEYCWVSDKYATLTGLTSTLPVYTPMPTPLPTYTATPATGFDLSYNGLIGCTSEWWAEISLYNSGASTFRSVEIIVRDMANSHEVSDNFNSFIDNYELQLLEQQVHIAAGQVCDGELTFIYDRSNRSPAADHDYPVFRKESGWRLRHRDDHCQAISGMLARIVRSPQCRPWRP